MRGQMESLYVPSPAPFVNLRTCESRRDGEWSGSSSISTTTGNGLRRDDHRRPRFSLTRPLRQRGPRRTKESDHSIVRPPARSASLRAQFRTLSLSSGGSERITLMSDSSCAVSNMTTILPECVDGPSRRGVEWLLGTPRRTPLLRRRSWVRKLRPPIGHVPSGGQLDGWSRVPDCQARVWRSCGLP